MATDCSQVSERQQMVETENCQLIIVQQCILLSISRSGYYYVSKNSISEQKKLLLDAIDALYTESPYLGTRKMVAELQLLGFDVERKQGRTCYNILNINAIYAKVKLTMPDMQHKKYPYLLR